MLFCYSGSLSGLSFKGRRIGITVVPVVAPLDAFLDEVVSKVLVVSEVAIYFLGKSLHEFLFIWQNTVFLDDE